MSRLIVSNYVPYKGYNHPLCTTLLRSTGISPLTSCFNLHVAKVKMVIRKLKKENSYRPFFDYRFREANWFKTLVKNFRKLQRSHKKSWDEAKVLWVQQSLDKEEKENALEELALFEIYCSLILFSCHPLYEFMSVREIERLEFPLSRFARLIIKRLVVSGDCIGYSPNWMIVFVISEKINKSNSFTSIFIISNFENMDFHK